jgi:hypothetical protein
MMYISVYAREDDMMYICVYARQDEKCIPAYIATLQS